MITNAFLAIVFVATMVALTDWRRGWFLFALVGVLQDPIRKMTPGTPVALSFAVVAIYLAMIVSASKVLPLAVSDLKRRYEPLHRSLMVLFAFVLLAAANGIVTFGLEDWMAPALALFIDCVPIPALILGYIYVGRDPDLTRYFSWYSVLTALALISVPMEYFRVDLPFLGTVALGQEWIRHFIGIQVRILSGSYRSPDIMAWHAAMVCILSIYLMMKRGFPRGWFWLGMASWGFLCCLMSGRRKMIYMVAVFSAVFLFRFRKRLTAVQIASVVLVALSTWAIVNKIASGEQSSVYTRGAVTSQTEVLDRLEGGTIETFREYGILGLGLGAATQGIAHVSDKNLGTWQEGGVSKLAVELGLPGLVAALMFGWALVRTLWRIAYAKARSRDDLMTRVALFAIFAANMASFLASHQPFTDAVLVLMNAFVIGALLGLPRLDEEEQQAPAPAAVPLAARTAAPAVAGV